jgi:hypothetical protein
MAQVEATSPFSSQISPIAVPAAKKPQLQGYNSHGMAMKLHCQGLQLLLLYNQIVRIKNFNCTRGG